MGRPPLRSASDAELLAALRRGDRVAFSLAVRRHQDALYTFCRRVLGSPALAEELARSALLAAFSGREAPPRGLGLRNWLLHLAAERLAGRAARPTDDPLDRSLAALPLEQRVPLVLRDVLGLDYAAIAAVLGLSRGTVRARIARARPAFARAWAERTGG